jgi:hypothetical protein
VLPASLNDKRIDCHRQHLASRCTTLPEGLRMNATCKGSSRHQQQMKRGYTVSSSGYAATHTTACTCVTSHVHWQ